MKIGIDIDNVISNFNDVFLEEYMKHDSGLRGSGIINENAEYFRRGMFDWSKEEEEAFYFENVEDFAKKLKPIKEAPFYIKKLHEDGHEIYIITGRDNGEYKEPEKMTIEWLKKYDIVYDTLILTDAYERHEKANACLENDIDIMIDDSIPNCQEMSSKGIKVFLMDTRYNRNEASFERVSNWKEIYTKISKMNKQKDIEKVNIILDTDIYNECDDQFALSYLIKSQDMFNIEAITIAPFHHDNDISIYEGTEKSYNEVIKICRLLDFDITKKVFKGATAYSNDGYNNSNEAVDKIIEIANKNSKTYILAIGAITNVALAIKKEPSIIDKLEIIWLGGNSLLCKDNMEFNFRQDVQAVKTVFESKAKLTIIPCKNVASNLTTSIYELEHFLKGKSELCDYLCERFKNDGFHEIQERRVIWDISVIAYMINKEWFEVEQISCPNIQADMTYEITENRHKITMVNYLNANSIYHDLFMKIGEVK